MFSVCKGEEYVIQSSESGYFVRLRGLKVVLAVVSCARMQCAIATCTVLGTHGSWFRILVQKHVLFPPRSHLFYTPVFSSFPLTYSSLAPAPSLLSF